MYMFSHWVTSAENALARAAVQRVVDCICSGGQRREINPLFLYGPTGTGKTHLVYALAAEVIQHCPNLIVSLVAASDCAASLEENGDSILETVQVSDLLILEDVHHLPMPAVKRLTQVFDIRLARQQQMIFTALTGPGQLERLPARLAARMACGLVVGLEPLAVPSRLALLQDQAQRRGLAISADVLAWLSEHVAGSGRQIEGALNRLETLTQLSGRPPDLATVVTQFQPENCASCPPVDRIAERVGHYFQVEPRQLCSQQRNHRTLLPRQIGMYLARRLTSLSLQQIGAFFGGRDHSTVLHACRKVELAMTRDTALSGAVRQLHADLG